MSKIGIDIAKWNTVKDWKSVKNSADFAILKIINKQCQTDGKYLSHLEGCKSVGLPIFGVYNYSYALSTDKAKYDAEKVITNLINSGLSTAVWLDIEDACQQGMKKKLIDIIRAYKDEIDKAGYPFGVYTGQSFYNTNLKPYQNYILDIPMWIARYYAGNTTFYTTSKINEGKKPAILNIVGWQYTSKGRVAGIAGDVDLDEYYADIAYSTTNGLANVALDSIYYPAVHSSETSLVRGLAGVGEKNTTFEHRTLIAKVNGITVYLGTKNQNIYLLNLLKQGKLIRA